jgi:hypothetical protein
MGSGKDSAVNADDMMKRVFEIKDEPMPRGAWWWWFWLFFFDNPKNPSKPRQLMILWSTKNVKEIDCNGLKIKLARSGDRSKLDGAVAAWYFDGEKMNHDFLLEQCDIKISDDSLKTDSSTPTSFVIDKSRNTIRIGDDFKFIADAGKRHSFSFPTYHNRRFIMNKGYQIIRLNHLDLSGTVDGKPIKGSAYFQRVFVNAPSPPWYWGIFHFNNGALLTYFNPHIWGRSIRKDISFYNDGKMHEFKDIDVKRTGEGLPEFLVRGENDNEMIRFKVSTYAHSSWTFRKRSLGIIPNKLVYNEYPAVISEIELIDKKTGKIAGINDLGKSIGNAEHTTGLLF